MTDIVVVGAGLFGCIISESFRRLGVRVVNISEYRAGAGSPPAGCVIRPSWVNTMSKIELRDSLRHLSELFELKDQEFLLKLTGKKVSCHRLEPDEVLSDQDVWVSKVVSVDEKSVKLASGQIIEANHGIILACGVWAQELAPWIGEVKPKWGYSFRGPKIEQPFIRVWAPYRQVVAFNMKNGMCSWVGDGSAYKEHTDFNAGKSQARCSHAIGFAALRLKPLYGARPYAETSGKPCLLRRGPGRQWAVTGGAKNGTVAAAWAALQLRREVLNA